MKKIVSPMSMVSRSSSCAVAHSLSAAAMGRVVMAAITAMTSMASPKIMAWYVVRVLLGETDDPHEYCAPTLARGLADHRFVA